MEQNKDQDGAAVRGEAVAEMNLAAAILSIPVEVPFEHQGISQRKAYMAGAEEVRAKAASKVSARAADAPSEPSELPTQAMYGMHWPEGYVADLNGKITPPKGRVNDFNFGYDNGYADGLQSIKGTVANIGAQAVAKSRAADALDSQPTEPYDLQSNEQYRQQMAGISCAAHGHWKEGDSVHPDYDTMPLRDIARLYAKYAALLANSQPTNESQWVDRLSYDAQVDEWAIERSNLESEIEQLKAQLASGKSVEPYGCAECRHTYCMSGEVCKACGDVAMQGWKGGRQPTDGGVRNG